ncbi:MAG: valine--tRNA ligase, partial [Rhizobiales bacterium]|nr:valine--tRNA ligase [Hyphomicrobiales bacterium]
MEKKYIHQDIEKRIYSQWEESNCFSASTDINNQRETYCIVIPPPNVTGNLHMGHALNNTLQDILIRFNRMQGKDVLWQAGTDHAGIATQMVVERKLDNEKNLRKEDLGRDEFVNEIWKWKEESGGQIINQLKRLGSSCDWERERFTLDEGLSKAVLYVFNKLFEDGLLYKDQRLVNWDTKFETAISDLEVQQIEIEGNLWYIKYPLQDDKSKFITIATTRPETMLGDTAIAVNPKDKKHNMLIGKMAIIPLSGRVIPIIGDDYAKMDEGTGAVKITPAHDFNDFEVGKRNNLEMLNILDKSGHLVDDDFIPKKYQKLERFSARKEILSDLKAEGSLIKTEKHLHNVPHGDRSGVIIEPYLTDQWYVDAKELSKKAIKAVKDKKTQFVPKNWEKTYFEWMDNIQPWCVSRQLWWGHQIPVWYGPDNHFFVAMDESEAKEKAYKHYGKDTDLVRDEDVLDTWFSSALWPFSTLGWPEKTPEFEKYYNTDVLVTGFDIIFFWVARMMMMGLYLTDDVPFHTIYIHALVRDEEGQKMSKSKGNVIDPLSLIEKYGADSLRFTLSSMAAQGRDIKLAESRVEGYRNFITKIWNAARFISTYNIILDTNFDPKTVKQDQNKWILGELDNLNMNVSQALDKFRFNDASAEIYSFIWHLFCDWYIEIIKDDMTQSGNDSIETKQTLIYTYLNLLKICHPFMPFVTEELNSIYTEEQELLVTSNWPSLVTNDTVQSKSVINFLIDTITEIRSIRSELRVVPSNKIKLLVLNDTNDYINVLVENNIKIQRMARLSNIEYVDTIPDNAIQFSISDIGFGLDLEGVVNTEEELARLDKELRKILDDLAIVDKKLENKQFL